MSLTVQQLLQDAKRLSSRLRDHDQSADHLISRAQEVLKEVDAMRQYQEDVENLNEVAHNRPRAQLVLGIQQENRHIRTLQQENKELRAALEEHQNALELIMSKYRQHVTKLVNAPHPDINNINNQKMQLQLQMLAERTEKVCEMASVMKAAVRSDELVCNEQQELMSRLMTENKGLRELLEISQRSLSTTPKVKRVAPTLHKEVQTEVGIDKAEEDRVETVTLPRPGGQAGRISSTKTSNVEAPSPVSPELISSTSPLPSFNEDSGRKSAELSSGDSDETGSEDESVKYDTIQRAGRRRTVIPKEEIDNFKALDDKVEADNVKVEEVFSSEVEVKKDETMDSVVAGLVHQLVSDTVEESSPATSVEESSPATSVLESSPATSVVENSPATSVGENSPATSVGESSQATSVGEISQATSVGKSSKATRVEEVESERNGSGNITENAITKKLIADEDKLIDNSDKSSTKSDKPNVESDSHTKSESDESKQSSDTPLLSDNLTSDNSGTDLSTLELAQTKTSADTSINPSHVRSNSKGKNKKPDKISPKKKKNNS